MTDPAARVSASADPAGAFAPAPAPLAAPYRGINAFRFVDAPLFFARDDDVRRMTQCVTVYRGTLLYGESGVGKSSLLNAGFLPMAIEQGFRPERVRVQPRRGEEIVVERVAVSLDGQPPYLLSNLVPESETGARTTMSTARFYRRVLKLSAEQRALLIFDQFEEFVTLFEEAPPGEDVAEALRLQSQILRVLDRILANHRIPVKLVLSFREDYLAKLTKLFERRPELPDQYLRLTPPEPTDLETIIRGPLERFPEAFGNKFPASLPARLADAFRERIGAGQVILTEVQIACWTLWHSDAPEALFDEKGVQGILEDFLSSEVAKFPGTPEHHVSGARDERDAVGALLARMVTRSGARNIVSRDDLIKLVEDETDLTAAELERLLFEMDGGKTRLVRSERRQEVLYYMIVSEFLVPWIQQWKDRRLREMERRAAERKLAEGLAEAARQLEQERGDAVQELRRQQAAAEHRRELELTDAARKREADRARAMRWLTAVALGAALILAALAVQLTRESQRTRVANSALADTTTSLRGLRDSLAGLARRQSDSIVAISARTAAAVAKAEALKAAQGNEREQLLAERQARVQLQAALRNGQTELRATQASLGSRQAELRSAQMQLDSSRAQLRGTEEELRNTQDALATATRHWAVVNESLVVARDSVTLLRSMIGTAVANSNAVAQLAVVRERVGAVIAAMRSRDDEEVRAFAARLCASDSALCDETGAPRQSEARPLEQKHSPKQQPHRRRR